MIKRIPEKFKEANFGTGSVGASDVAESAIHLASADPTAASDTGSGFVVGSIWVNTSSGQQFVATSVSAEDATWYGQEGDIINEPFKIQGSTSYFNHTFSGPSGYPANTTKGSMTSDGNSADVGEGIAASYSNQGSIRNDTHCYFIGAVNGPAPTAHKQSIHRFSLTAPHNSTDVGESVFAPSYPSGFGQSGGTTDGTYGFSAGAQHAGDSSTTDNIEKFTLASPAPSSDYGNELSVGRAAGGGVSDVANGYGFTVGGATPTPTNVIDRISFTSPATATDWGNTTSSRKYGSTHASITRGYLGGGTPPATNAIDSFLFSSPGDATDWGDLTESKNHMSGAQSTTHAYLEGGQETKTTIEKFQFASAANASDVGEAPLGNQGGSMTEV